MTATQSTPDMPTITYPMMRDAVRDHVARVVADHETAKMIAADLIAHGMSASMPNEAAQEARLAVWGKLGLLLERIIADADLRAAIVRAAKK
jgi:hypothetical protein